MPNLNSLKEENKGKESRNKRIAFGEAICLYPRQNQRVTVNCIDHTMDIIFDSDACLNCSSDNSYGQGLHIHL